MLSFREHREAMLVEMSQQIGEVEFNFTKHFMERFSERSQISKDQLNGFLHRIIDKLPSIDPEGQFLFYSKKLQQGVIAAWDAFKRKMHMITFLPPNKKFSKDAAEVVVESITYKVIVID